VNRVRAEISAVILKRRQDWEIRLHEFLAARRDQPFEWGKNDCALFVCDAIQAMTDIDCAPNFRDFYSNSGAAKNLIRQFGSLGALAQQLAEKQGFPEVPVLMAQRGDVALADLDGQTLLVVSLDGRFAVGPGLRGWVEVPIEKCSKAWRI